MITSTMEIIEAHCLLRLDERGMMPASATFTFPVSMKRRAHVALVLTIVILTEHPRVGKKGAYPQE